MDRVHGPKSGKRSGFEMSRHAWSALLAATVVLVLVVVGAGGAVVLLGGHKRPPGRASAVIASLSSRNRGLVGILGVLRRPQTQADLDPAMLRATELQPAQLAGTPVRSLIRLATVTSWGDKIFLVPYQPPTPKMLAQALSRRRLPAALKRSWLASRGHALRLGVFDSGGSGCCERAAAIESGDSVIESGPSPNAVVIVVPDGVAKVTVLAPRAVTATVHNNVAAFVVHQPVENLSIDKMVWYGPSGNVVNRIGYARRHPSARS